MATTDVISLDHNYTKHHASSSCGPKCRTRFLFMQRPQRPGETDSNVDLDEIDVCEPELLVFAPKNCHVASLSFEESDELWEETLDMSAFSSEQQAFFIGIINILKAFQLSTGALLDRTGSKRHHFSSKACLRLLNLLSQFNYNRDMLLWIHQLLKTSTDYFSPWTEILNNFNAKYRGLFEKLDLLSGLGCLPAKPVAERPKLPCLPFIKNVTLIVLPPRPHWFLDSRQKTFLWYMSKFFHVKCVKLSHRASNGAGSLTLRKWLRSMILETRSLIKKTVQTDELHESEANLSSSSYYDGKNKVVLLGWGVSAMAALQLASRLASVEADNSISSVICLAPTILSFTHGLRGHANDPLQPCSIRFPVMFVTGEYAVSSNVDDLEDFRDRINPDINTRLIVIGGVNDRLALCSAKKQSCYLSQAEVDLSVVEEIYSFVSFVVTGISSEMFLSQEESERRGQEQLKMNQAGSKRSTNLNKSSVPRNSKSNRSSQMSSYQAVALSSPSHRTQPTAVAADAGYSVSVASSQTQLVVLPHNHNSEQIEVACHDYAASTLPANTVCSPAGTVPVYNSGSEQSLRYMLSAGSSTTGEPSAMRASTTSTNPINRGTGPVVFRKKVVTSMRAPIGSYRSSRSDFKSSVMQSQTTLLSKISPGPPILFSSALQLQK